MEGVIIVFSKGLNAYAYTYIDIYRYIDYKKVFSFISLSYQHQAAVQQLETCWVSLAVATKLLGYALSLLYILFVLI